MDSADPIDGWHLPDILKTNSGPAKNDVYGKLCTVVKDVMSSSMKYISTHDVDYRLSNCNAAELPAIFEIRQASFARIEVCICGII